MLDNIRQGQCPLSLFLSNVNECVSNSESKKYVEGLNSKVKLGLYKAFSKAVEIKMYLHGVGLVMPELDSCLSLGQEHMV